MIEKSSSATRSQAQSSADRRQAKSFEETVRDYLRQELTNHEETFREAVLARAESLLGEVQA